MHVSRVKARTTRKPRTGEAGRVKAARPAHPSKGMANRTPRVKPRAGRIAVPAPANDTMPLPAEELGLPVLPDMAVEAAVAEPVEELVENDTEELAAGAVEAQEDSDEDDE